MQNSLLIKRYRAHLESAIEEMERQDVHLEYGFLKVLEFAFQQDQFLIDDIDWFHVEARIPVPVDSRHEHKWIEVTKDMDGILESLCKTVTEFWVVVNKYEEEKI